MAHYAESLLATSEHIVRVQRQHWFTIVDAAKWGVLSLVGAIVLFFVGGALAADGASGTFRQLLGLVTLGLVIYTVVALFWAYLRWSTDEYVLTNRRVMQVQGIINKRTTDSSLEKINDAVLSQSFLGRIFGFGDLDVLTASESGIERMRMLVDAAGFKKGMLDAKHELELELSRGGMPSPPLRAPAPMVPVAAGDRFRDGAEVAEPLPARTPPPAPVRAPEPPAARGPRPMTPDEVTDTLERLADLRDRGAITPEEYDAKKADLLGRL